MGIHPASDNDGGTAKFRPPLHSISLVCDDIASTKAELEAKGAEFSGIVEDLGFGIGATLKVPGAGEMLLYQPKHPEAHSL